METGRRGESEKCLASNPTIEYILNILKNISLKGFNNNSPALYAGYKNVQINVATQVWVECIINHLLSTYKLFILIISFALFKILSIF